MGPIFEGDVWFCVIAIIVSELLADIPWLSDQLRLPGIVMISLIFALQPMFSYGQRSKCADLLNSYKHFYIKEPEGKSQGQRGKRI